MQYAMTIPATGRSRIVVSSILAFRTSALRGNERANFARVSEDHVRAVILRCWRTSEFISYLALEITSDKSSYRNQSSLLFAHPFNLRVTHFMEYLAGPALRRTRRPTPALGATRFRSIVECL